MTESTGDAAGRIHRFFDEAVEEGLRPESVSGASDAEIDDMATAQRARAVPAAAREVLRLIGTDHGLWLPGSSLGVRTVQGSAKDHAIATLAAEGDPLRDSAGALVLVEHGAYTYHLIDGADLDHDDPPVWLLTEGEAATQRWNSVTDWFEAITPDIERYRERLEIMRETGDDFVPAWAQHIDAG
jgi:hypothetical protein